MDDGWDMVRGGFRIDWDASDEDALIVQGDLYSGNIGQTIAAAPASLLPPYTATFSNEIGVSGGHLLSRWQRTFSAASDMAVQLYYDRTRRGDRFNGSETRNTFDADFQHRFGLGVRQEVMWGLGYRLSADKFDNTFNIFLDPASRTDHLFSAFVQDDIHLVDNRLRLTAGTKFERNTYTGFEIQPNLRLLWTPAARHNGWAAVSRAVRTPSRFESDSRLVLAVVPADTLAPLVPGVPVGLVTGSGNPAMKAEELLALEAGYRARLTDRLFADVASFYNIYDNLRSAEPGALYLEAEASPPHFVFPVLAGNKMAGETYGVELAADWQVLDQWRLRPTYSYLQIQLRLDADSRDPGVSLEAEGQSPQHQFALRSALDLPRDVALDLGIHYVDALPDFGVKSYIEVNAHLGWKPVQHLELALVGHNLFDERHREFPSDFGESLLIEVERSVYGMATWGL